jgi:hypothetical protein
VTGPGAGRSRESRSVKGTNAVRYEIRIQGHLAPRRLDCFENLEIAHHPDGETRIEGILDPSALYGLLNHLYHLGATLLSVQRAADPRRIAPHKSR